MRTEHYLDNSATTPVLREAAEAASRLMLDCFGNPSSLHTRGFLAKKELDAARAIVAARLGAQPEEIVFTSGGTEANNLALFGAANARKRLGRKIVATAVEHDSVLRVMAGLEGQGFTVEYLRPGPDGRVSEEALAQAIDGETILVSVMLVNNETGARFPVEEIAAGLQGRPALFHTDAVQGFLKVPFTAKSLGADYITISAHKVGGPKGIGALYIGGRAKNTLPLFHGGGQESGLRPGTEATGQIAGFARAVELRLARREEIAAHLAEISAYARARLGEIPDLRFIGPGDAPHILAVSLPGYPSQNIVGELGEQGICISAGSACHRGKASHVLEAMGLDKRTAAGTVRVSFGPETTREDIDALAEALLAHKNARFPML